METTTLYSLLAAAIAILTIARPLYTLYRRERTYKRLRQHYMA